LATFCFEEEKNFRHNFESVSPYGDFRQKKKDCCVANSPMAQPKVGPNGFSQGFGPPEESAG
jgi:hypothetical protein